MISTRKITNIAICVCVCVCVSRISLHQAHIDLHNGIVELTMSFTNELSDSIILVLILIPNFATTH